MGGRSNAEGSRAPPPPVPPALFSSCHASAGISQLRAIIEPIGYSVSVVCMNKALHLKSAATSLPDGTIIGHLPSLDSDHPFSNILPTPGNEVNGAHVVKPEGGAHLRIAFSGFTASCVGFFNVLQVLLGPNKVLMADGCPLTRAALIERGLDVVQENTTQSSLPCSALRSTVILFGRLTYQNL
jgi:N-dimethylarginine dimethylaminohydrolase